MQTVVVIGAGPAGCIAAILLARGGFTVHLLEQHTFPRDKVCGECISALGIEVLRRVGVARQIEELHPAVFTRAALYAPDSAAMDVPLPRAMWGVSRSAFDAALLDAARDADAIVHQPARCEQVLPAATPIVRYRCLRSNEIRELTGNWVLIADGKGAAPAAASDLGIKAHFTNVAGPRDTIELFGVNGHYGGLAAVEGDRWNAAFSVPTSRVRHSGGDIDSMFRQIVRENATLTRRLSGATRVSRWLASPLPRFPVRSEWPQRVIPLGNAAAALEPVGGEGIGLAMRSAELAAAELSNASGHGGNASPMLAKRFDSLWRPRSWSCRFTARLLSSPHLADAAAALVSANQPILKTLLSLTGKD